MDDEEQSKTCSRCHGPCATRNFAFCLLFSQTRSSVDAVFELEKYKQSPIAKGGLEIILKATFRIEESKRLNLLRLKELIEKNYELDLGQVPMPSSNDLEVVVRA